MLQTTTIAPVVLSLAEKFSREKYTLQNVVKKRSRTSSSTIEKYQNAASTTSLISSLPEEIWKYILVYLEGKELVHVASTAKYFNSYVFSPRCERIWQRRCIEVGYSMLVSNVDAEIKSTWSESYCAAKRETLQAVPMYACDSEFDIKASGEYSLVSFEAFLEKDNDFPWDEKAHQLIQEAIEKDEQFLQSQNMSLLPACCALSFKGYKFLFINRTNFEFAEGSNLVPVTAHHFHFQTAHPDIPKLNDKYDIQDGILLAPTAFLSGYFDYDFERVKDGNLEQQQLLIHSSFATENSTIHYQKEPVNAFKMHRLPTMDTVVQLFTCGKVTRSGNGNNVSLCNKQKTYLYEPRYVWPWYLRLGSFPSDPDLYLALSVLENEQDTHSADWKNAPSRIDSNT